MVASEAEDDVPKNPVPPTTAPTAVETEDRNTKRFYRHDAWMAMRKRSQDTSAAAAATENAAPNANAAPPSNHINRKIPYFPEADVVAERLASTTEFQQAKNIKVNIDLAQEAVKLQALWAAKTLFVAPSQKSDYLYAKIKPCNLHGVPLTTQKRIVKMLGGVDTYEELGIEQAEPLDMIVVGCVAVTEQGQRIGKGNGYVDLEIAILVDLGVITNRTVIATTVADEQVYGPLPADLFQPYDFTIDLIVTPTRIIRVANRPEPRAIGVQWGLLSSRRLEVVRVLKKLKERLEAQGKHIELKDEDTDVESFRKSRNQPRGGAGGGGGGGGQRRQQNRRRRGGLGRSGGGGAESGGAGDQKEGDGDKQQRDEGEEGGGRMRRKRRYPRKPRRYQRRDSSEFHKEGEGGDQQQEQHYDGNSSGKEHPSGSGRRRSQRGGGGGGGGGGDGGAAGGERGGENRERGGAGEGGRPRRRPQHPYPGGVRIRVSNMFSVRFKDFKDELRARDCYPSKIRKGRYGKCLLIFPKRGDGPTDEQQQVEGLLQKLADMRITVLPDKEGGEPKQVELKCELQPPKQPGQHDDDDVDDDDRDERQRGDGHGDGPRSPGGRQQQQQQQGDGPPAPPTGDENDEASKSYSPLKEPSGGGGGGGGQHLVY
uniref:5-formyltetrahydrofolate cyclo-ligase n=1 Tax=Anopheles atroparvus TaxID=41427 RepID=A0A182ILR0_ANOAO